MQDGYELLQISFNKSFYAFIALSCLNRFLILPWYDKFLTPDSDNEKENTTRLTELVEEWKN